MVTLCRTMQVSRSGFYQWLQRDAADDPEHAELIWHVRSLDKLLRHRAGSRRMAFELQKRGFAVGRHRVRSLMREAGIECQQRRRRRTCSTTDSQHRQPVAPNVLRRQFQVEAPNDVWVADITALWTFEGWLYLAAIMDLYDHQLIGYALSDSMPVALPLEALEMAVRHRRPGPGLIHHSDQGSQYASTAYQGRMDALGFVPSMSRKGNCWDNAVMERFFGSLKSEWTDARVYTTREAARLDVVEYIEMQYNSVRPHTALGSLSPREWEKAAA